MSTSKLRIAIVIAIALALLLALAAAAVVNRHRLLVETFGDGKPPALLDQMDEGADARWLDDYFLVVEIDPQTFVIAEPRYNQQNLNYLIVGHDKAVLFDAGSGLRDVAAAAATLTDKPITFIPSHLHYDHIGNAGPYARTALVDLPHLRSRATGSPAQLQLTWQEHLGQSEGYAAPVMQVDEWLIPGSVFSLGGRALRILYTPGHTDDSISLLDSARGFLFSGDFIYSGPLYAFLPNSSLGDYRQGAETLLESVAEDVRVFGAHRSGPPGAPVLSRADIKAVKEAIDAIEAKRLPAEGSYPVSYAINDRISLLAEPAWLQKWDQRYPEL